MIDLNIDMRQYDCPFIDTTDDIDVALSAVQWQLDPDAEKLETRLLVRGDSRDTLEAGLRALQSHDNMHSCSVFSKLDDMARISAVIEETDAMRTIDRNGGYITGPFQTEDGRETWHVGFDTAADENRALAELDRHNEFEVETREQFDTATLFDLLENSSSALQLLNGCRSLTETEQDALRCAFDQGYYETPRGTTLEQLASEFGVSKTAVSMNLRRGERKLLDAAMGALSGLDENGL